MKAYGRFHALTYDLATLFTGYARAPRLLAREFLKQAGPAAAGMRIMDFGCGTGLLTAALNKQHPGLKITGIDPSEEMLKIYRKKAGTGVAALRGGYNNGLAFANAANGAILASGVFDHLTIDAGLMKEFLRTVKPGGFLAFTYERHGSGSPCIIHQGEGRVFRSYLDDYVRRAVEEGGGVVAQQKKISPGYIVNGGHFLPHHVRFGIMVVKKPEAPKTASPQP